LPEDLIEEIARLYGYNKIPTHQISGNLVVNRGIEAARDLHKLRQAFCDLSYHEIISYSFVDAKLQSLLDPQEKPVELLNPITAEMSVMRTNMWPGLVNTLLYNKSRQQHRVRLFETGTCFISRNDELKQEKRLAGLISGLAQPEQWAVSPREADFFDLKGDVEAILSQSFPLSELVFKPESHPALHPGQAASVHHQQQKIGLIGALHPNVLQALDVESKVFVFEIDLDLLPKAAPESYHELSKFPEIRRDIAILVNQTVPAKQIQDTIKVVAGSWLKDVFIFDVYQGKGISPGLKSIALALILQHPARTLVDEEIAAVMDRVISELKGQLGAELRR
jgi:phenylalanyl-tRNA synthetase beta chain